MPALTLARKAKHAGESCAAQGALQQEITLPAAFWMFTPMTQHLPDHFWSSLALFLLPALSLAVPSGYSYGPALLILASLFSVRVWWGKWALPKEVWWMYGSFALLALCWLIDNWISGDGSSAFEKPAKMLITLPCLLYLAQRPPQARWLWHGVVVGALGALMVGGWQILSGHPSWSNDHRITGFNNAIQFGNLALLLGLLSLCGWNAASTRRLLWRSWLSVGFAAGLLASLLSGSRGGWLSLVLLAGMAFLYLLASGHWRAIVALVILGTVGLWAALQLPQLHLQERIALAQHQVHVYREHGNAATSVGARLQMWQFGWSLYRERPILGWSQQGYMEQKRLAMDAKRLDPYQAEFNHPHNEILDAASKRGTVGLLILLLAYASPLFLFAGIFRSTANRQLRALGLAGMVVPIAYIGFGLTQAFLPHNNGITMYVYVLCLIWAAAWGWSKRQPSLA